MTAPKKTGKSKV